MAYKYPKISNSIEYRQHDEGTVEVIDYITDEVYVLEAEEAEFIKKLDGRTNLYDIETSLKSEEIDSLIDDLDYNYLIRYSNIANLGGGTVLFTLFEVKESEALKRFAAIYNRLLQLLWLPALIIGALVLLKKFPDMNFDYAWLGVVAGIFSGLFLHEFGHMFSGISNGAKVTEMGFLISNYIMPGAYVLMDNKDVEGTLKRVQIVASGIESNVFLTGVFLVLSSVSGFLGGAFLVAAVENMVIAVLNLTMVKGLDGMLVMCELLGIENIADNAKRVLFSRKRKQRIKRKGPSGYATVAVCYIFSALQLALPLLIILNVLEVISCFV